MSFSAEVKEELFRQIPEARHCQLAEISAILGMCGHGYKEANGQYSVYMQTENAYVARKCFTLLQKTFNIEARLLVRQNQKENSYQISVQEMPAAEKILQALGMVPEEKEQNRWSDTTQQAGGAKPVSLIHSALLQKRCCRRAFLRGVFLASGSISDPNKFYHFEIVCPDEEKAEQIRQVIGCFDIDARIVGRKNHYVVYVKEGAQIVELLGIMGANISVLNLENVRILKEMRGSVNRKVNCETANINKTVNAAVKQTEDIRFIQERMGFSALPEGLAEIAKLRLEYPEATLAELGAMLTPAVGKSGVNHRLRKLKVIADELKSNKEENAYD